MSEVGSDRLRDRLVLAALEALTDGDPVLLIGVGDNEVRLGWADGVTDAATATSFSKTVDSGDNDGPTRLHLLDLRRRLRRHKTSTGKRICRPA